MPTITFAKALETVQKDQPGTGDVHIEGAGTPAGKRKTARTYREVVDGYAPGRVGKGAAPENGGEADGFTLSVPITKFDADKRQVFGWASVIEKDGQPVIDSQGDIIPLDELEPAAYDFVVSSREGDDMHVGTAKSHLIESMVFTPEKQEALGINLGKVAWWTGWQIDDDALWAAHKRGDRPELSIGGTARREEV